MDERDYEISLKQQMYNIFIKILIIHIVLIAFAFAVKIAVGNVYNYDFKNPVLEYCYYGTVSWCIVRAPVLNGAMFVVSQIALAKCVRNKDEMQREMFILWGLSLMVVILSIVLLRIP